MIPANDIDSQLAEWDSQILDLENRLESYEYAGATYSTDNETEELEAECYLLYYHPPVTCNYDVSDNLSHFEDKLIKEISGYTEFERHPADGICNMERDEYVSDPYASLGPILGNWTGKVDDEYNETNLWIKRSNSMVREGFTDFLEKFTQYSVILSHPTLVFIAGIRCLGRLLSGKSCNFSGAVPDPPIDEIEALLPGVGTHHIDDMYIGLWHMMHVEREGLGEFNNIPGTHIEWAGPGMKPGELDMAVMIIADLTGVTLNASKSTGVDRYGPLDDKKVRKHIWEWQDAHVGHLEFSSLSNLAQYGWKAFQADPTHSRILGWPLHALGDTIIPHHLLGTMSHGHKAYEIYMERNIEGMMQAESGQLEIIANAYKWWKRFCWDASTGQRKDLESAKTLIDAVAKDNYQYIGDWAWNDVNSFDENFDKNGEREHKIDLWERSPEAWGNSMSMVRNSSGATMALLMSAANMVESNGNGDSSAVTKCPDGYGYCSTWACGFQCVEGHEAYIPSEQDGIRPTSDEDADGQCADDPCNSNDDCPADAFCSVATGCCIVIE
ncbi:MAG: hypothetical protein JXX14_05995 [Deltaproteobacteria bacterium]|nr:hypothetical protein [Deltaproteobacteria bacterium]